MASGNIKADYSVMLETSNLILNRASLIEDLFNRVKAEYDSLNSSYWQAESAVLFSERIANLASNFEPTVNEFLAAGNSLNAMASNYENVDSAAKSSVDPLYILIDEATGEVIGGNSSEYKKGDYVDIPNSEVSESQSISSSNNSGLAGQGLGGHSIGGGAGRRSATDVPKSSIGSYTSVNEKWHQIKDGGPTEI